VECLDQGDEPGSVGVQRDPQGPRLRCLTGAESTRVVTAPPRRIATATPTGSPQPYLRRSGSRPSGPGESTPPSRPHGVSAGDTTTDSARCPAPPEAHTRTAGPGSADPGSTGGSGHSMLRTWLPSLQPLFQDLLKSQAKYVRSVRCDDRARSHIAWLSLPGPWCRFGVGNDDPVGDVLDVGKQSPEVRHRSLRNTS
jgi:hypothetical protein